MKPLTAEEIAELRRLESAGTPVPWNGGSEDGKIDGPGPEYWQIARDAYRNGDLIVAARNALPRLLDEVEQSRKRQADHVTVMDIAHRHANDLKAQIDRLRALLKRIEWMGSAYPDASDMPCCPACDSQHKHEPGCELATLLGP